MTIHIVRALYLLVVVAIITSFASQANVEGKGPTYYMLFILIPSAAAFVLIMVDMFWRRKRLQAISGLFFGTLAGLVFAYALGHIVNLARNIFAGAGEASGPAWDLMTVVLGASAVFLCITVVLQTKSDFRFVIPYVEFSRQIKGARHLVLDTSAIIDGRIADVSETGILEPGLIVPRFVLEELQSIADSNDKLRRNRGRRGLDVLNQLQGNKKLDIEILDTHVAAVDEATDVDAKLVALAKHLNTRIVTNDYNLGKIAQLRGVGVINLNDLANALKPILLPGETLSVKMIKAGEEPGQGIGYLEDGTMVVAEQGRDYLGREIVITTTSVLQTSAGRMIFGKLNGDKTLGPQGQGPRENRS